MDLTSIKNSLETAKEVESTVRKMDDFNPDERIGELKENIDKGDVPLKDEFDPDKRIEEPDYYTSEEERIDRTPSETSDFGSWEGARGNSKFIPSDVTEKGKEAIDKLAEYGEDGIVYKNGEPDFSKCSEATVQIDNMTENRHNYFIDGSTEIQKGNFAQADTECAKQWTTESRMKEDGTTEWNQKDVQQWRHNHRCTWHECCDRKTMHLVSRDIHASDRFSHSGGCAECRIRDNKDLGGIFDD